MDAAGYLSLARPSCNGGLRTLPPRPTLALHKTLPFFSFLYTYPTCHRPPAYLLPSTNLVLTHRIRGGAAILQPFPYRWDEHHHLVPGCRIDPTPNLGAFSPYDALIGAIPGPETAPDRCYPRAIVSRLVSLRHVTCCARGVTCLCQFIFGSHCSSSALTFTPALQRLSVQHIALLRYLLSPNVDGHNAIPRDHVREHVGR